MKKFHFIAFVLYVSFTLVVEEEDWIVAIGLRKFHLAQQSEVRI